MPFKLVNKYKSNVLVKNNVKMHCIVNVILIACCVHFIVCKIVNFLNFVCLYY